MSRLTPCSYLSPVLWVSPWKLRIPGACTKIDLAARNAASSEVVIFDEFAGSYRSVYESTDMQQKTNINSKE